MGRDIRFHWLCVAAFAVIITLATTEDISPKNAVLLSLQDFSIRLLKLLNTQSSENVVFSPLSIGAVLGLVAEGAKGNTYKEIATLLSLPEDIDSKRKNFEKLLDSIQYPNLKNRVFIQDSAYTDEKSLVLPEYLQVIRNYYDAEARMVNIGGNPSEAELIINKWVSKPTNGRINTIVNFDSVDEKTKLVLVNTILFKGIWDSKFDEYATSVQTFYHSSVNQSDVNMMNGLFLYNAVELEELDALALEIPYKNEEYGMMIVLPNKLDGLSALLDKIGNFSIEQIRKKLDYRLLNVSLPRFKIDTKLDLVDSLKQLGVNEMFGGNANLSGIAGPEDGLVISAAIHKAEIENKETGMVTPPVGGVVIHLISTNISPFPTIEFKADHPFLFFVMDLRSGAPVLAGSLSHPTSAS